MRVRSLPLCLCMLAAALQAGEEPAVPRIDSVELLVPQPWKQQPSLIWYDDFDGAEETQRQYHEYDARNTQNIRTNEVFLGAAGQSLRMHFPKGSQGVGGRKLCFGDCPFGPPLRKGEKFEELYWRVYVKHPPDWTGGGPDKMSRCTSFTSNNWTQGMIGHVWSAGEALTLDPATGVKDGRVVSTRYNDFPNLKWLGNKPVSPLALHAADETGRWVCVEAHVKLNTPGQKDGVMRLWLDGLLQCDRKGLDWRGTYKDHGINAVFLEAYWNKGSPVEQSRWFDDFVVSTQPIGPAVTAPHPVLRKTPFKGAEGTKQAAWELQIAERIESAADGAERIFKRLPDEWSHQKGEDAWVRTVWTSAPEKTGAQRIAANAQNGTFTGTLAGKTGFAPDKLYFCRCRQQDDKGNWSAWSSWHQPFKVAVKK